MSNNVEQKRILWIENDKELTDRWLKKFYRRHKQEEFGIKVLRSREDAAAELKEHLATYSALIVDVMLPRDSAAAEQVETLEKQRVQLLDQLGRAASPDDDEARRMKDKNISDIESIDRQLDELTDLGGGVVLLEQLPKSVYPLKLLTIVLSARTMPNLQARAKRLVETGKFYWTTKPITADYVFLLIEKHCG
jgi:hypothetical protein